MSCVYLVVQPSETECTLPACSQMQDPPWKADAAALAALELLVEGHMLPTPLAAAVNGGELQLPSVCLKTADIERCKPGVWLNDKLINFGMWRLQQRDAAMQGGNSKWPELNALWQGQQHVSCHFSAAISWLSITWTGVLSGMMKCAGGRCRRGCKLLV
jgi:hypothetical protein